MIKKYKIIILLKSLIIFVFFISPSFGLSNDYQNELRNGCYVNSKQYLGNIRAKEYCICTVQMLSKKYNNAQINQLFKKEPKEIMKGTEFASIHCEKNKKAF